MHGLPEPSPRFGEKKAAILRQLAVPDAEYTDASPKGSVDEGVRALLGDVNRARGLVTTSSCAGRLSVFLEGSKAAAAAAAAAAGGGHASGQVAGVGGKGAGGTWLFVSHEAIGDGDAPFRDFVGRLGMEEGLSSQGQVGDITSQRLIHFKFEPMILHVLTASLDHAQLLLRCALQAGFRESGAVSLSSQPATAEPAMPMVAVRSTGLSFESLIGFEAGDGRRLSLVSPSYLQSLVRIASERFEENARRISRFQAAFRDALSEPAPRLNPQGKEWEDAAARRERKRAEGLQRKAELEAQQGSEDPASAEEL